MYEFRKIAAIVTTFVILLGATPIHRVELALVSVDGQDSYVPSVQNKDSRLMVAVEPLANKLGVPIKHFRGSVLLQVDGEWVSVAPQNLVVNEGQSPLMRLTTTPEKRGGSVYVDADDVSNLLDVSVTRLKNRLDVTRKSAPGTVTSQRMVVKELPTPTPRPTATPVSIVRSNSYANPNTVPDNRRQFGTASLNVNSMYNNRSYNAMFDGGSGVVHASLQATGASGSGASFFGSVRAGQGDEHVAVGGIADPLYGQLFVGNGANGIEVENAAAVGIAWANTGTSGRHVIAVTKKLPAEEFIAAFASQFGVTQPLLGFEQSSRLGSGTFQRDVWFGLHGVGAGVHYRTDGRLFADVRTGFAGAGLPLTQGDAPTQITAGYNITSSFGFRGGISSGRGIPVQPAYELFGHASLFNYTVGRFGQESVANLGFSGRSAFGTLYYDRGPGGGTLNGTGQIDFRTGVLEALMFAGANNSNDLALDYRFRRDGPSITLGGERVTSDSQTRIGPVLGFEVPLTVDLSAGFALHPLLHGNGIRYELHQRLLSPLRSSIPMRYVNLAYDAPVGVPVFVMVDGVRTVHLSGTPERVAIPATAQYVALESSDGKYAAPEQRVDPATSAVQFALWPVVEIRGQVSVSDAAVKAIGSRPALGAITVLLEPGDIATQTDEDGNFDFPAQAINPKSTITLDASTIPNGLGAPKARAIVTNGSNTFVLQSDKKIQKIIF